ncbi:hypothetical protein CHCC20335_0873 [Bacillus paralicheniformis]|nr:hypothetical protein CHCC20335_0873 [Bacillus paralicheniformis]
MDTYSYLSDIPHHLEITNGYRTKKNSRGIPAAVIPFKNLFF